MATLRQAMVTLALAGSLATGGCATPARHWTAPPDAAGATVAPVRTLARIVLLPPLYETDGEVPVTWTASTEHAGLLDATLRFLTDWKGYRVQVADTGRMASGRAADELRGALLAHQRSQSTPDARLPADLATRVREFAVQQQADGVALLGVMHVDLNAQRWALIYGTALVTLGVGQWFYLDSLGTYTDAAIFDGATGALLWWGRNQAASAGQPAPATDIPRFAFDALPTALRGVADHDPKAGGR